MERKQLISQVRRVVIKIGSSILTDPEGGPREGSFRSIARSVGALASKKELILVSSGAIACGMKKLGFKKRPRTISELQACAAIGQATLVQIYERAFSRQKLMTAQILLTRGDIEDRRRYINVKHTLAALLKKGVIPIINENDTVAVEEINVGDNDTLAAFVAILAGADLLLVLTDCDGFHTKDPRFSEDAERISVVRNVDEESFARAKGSAWETRVGGMTTKLEAVRMAARSGIPTIIANGNDPDTPKNVFRGMDVGTLFLPGEDVTCARKHWIGSRKSRGRLVLDSGAISAITKGKKSLLARGITAVCGNFVKGDSVDLTDNQGTVIARGLASYSSAELEKIRGANSSEIENILGYRSVDEVVHRDDMVVIC